MQPTATATMMLNDIMIRVGRRDALASRMEGLFYNQDHDAGGRFTGPGGGSAGSGSLVAEKPSAENTQHLKVAVAALREARRIVPAATQEGIVLEHTHKLLSLYTLGKAFDKVGLVNAALREKFAKADSWLKSDPSPGDRGLVHGLVQKAKAALSYMTGGDLRHITYMAAVGSLIGLAAHLSAGVAGKGNGWPPEGWSEHIQTEIAKTIGERVHGG